MAVTTWPTPFTPNTIIAKPLEALGRRREEYLVAGTPTPGMLVYVSYPGSVKKWAVHPTAGGAAQMWILVEDSLQGRTIDTNYVDGDPGFGAALVSGDQFYGFIAAGVHAVPQTMCSSNGDGTFKNVGGSDVPLCRPVNEVDNSGGGAAVRCMFEVL